MAKRTIISFNIRIELADKLDKHAKELGLSRNRCLEHILEIYFTHLSLERNNKPKTIRDSIIRWLITGEWIDPEMKI